MKKLLLIAILMLALVFTVVACTDDPKPEDTTDNTTVETPTTEEPSQDATEEPSADVTDEPGSEEPSGDPDATTQEPSDVTTEEPPEVTTEEPSNDPPVTTEEPTVDPDEPVLVIDPEKLHANATSTGGQTFVNEVSASEIITEGGYTFVRLTPDQAGIGDAYVTAIDIGSAYTLPGFLAISYRNNSGLTGEMFIGSGAGWSGQGDNTSLTWATDGEWNLLIVDLSSCGLTSIEDGFINYLRLDFFAGKGAEGETFDIEYVAFFNSAEAAVKYDFEKHPPYVEPGDAGMVNASFDTFYVNGTMYFPEDGGAGDKLAAQDNTISFDAGDTHDSTALRGWIGFSQPIAEFGYFIDNYQMVYGDFKAATEDGVKAAGGEHASRFQITVPLAELEAGIHKVGFVVKLEDGTVVRLREDLKVVIVPNLVSESITLASGHGAPFSGAPNNYFGQRYNIGESILQKISIPDMATYTDGNTNTWSLKIWQWNTDYATTVAAAPLFSVEGENHPDNTTFNLDVPASLFITGDIYYEIAYLSGTGCFTGWTADSVAEGVETYVAGSLATGSYGASLVVGNVSDAPIANIPPHQIVNAPVYIIDAKDMVAANANQVTMEKMDGYNHFVPSGGDPNFMLFNNQTGSRYVSIKYRTEYVANIQIFLGSTGAGPVDDSTMMEQALIPDGQWHLAIFDTQTLVDRGVYDGSTAAYLRLDVMESGYECDENGEPIRDPDGTWHKLPLPEGATIDIAYFAFFDTEEKANQYEYPTVAADKSVYTVGEAIMVTAQGGGTDWVGIASVDATETIRWWYVDAVGAGAAINVLDNAAIQAGTGAATGELPVGNYYIVWVPNDQSWSGATGVITLPISIVEAVPVEPEKPAFPGNPAHFSICADNVRAWVGENFTDLCNQEAHLYMASVNGQINVDGLDFISFRGWANPTIGGIEIDQFGYQIDSNEPVFSSDFWKDEPDLNTALGSPVAKRYENIKIPVSELSGGSTVYLLVKDTNGVIYCMNSVWGTITIA